MFQRHDDGLSLVEVVVAMFLFGIISLAVLPLLIGGISLSTVNRDVVSATTLANDRLAQLRKQFPTSKASVATCDALLLAIGSVDPDDPGNPDLTVAASATADPDQTQACPTAAAAYPRTVLVRIVVSDQSGKVVSVPTRIMVGKKS